MRVDVDIKEPGSIREACFYGGAPYFKIGELWYYVHDGKLLKSVDLNGPSAETNLAKCKPASGSITLHFDD